ncbi:hypothetical protein [uncultured Vagococcus sp.]|nr:hypothetical protein [uncultured Vagococcus sp.]
MAVAVIREVAEELGLLVTDTCFFRCRYYEPSNTLMMDFISAVAGSTC